MADSEQPEPVGAFTKEDYEALARFRYGIRLYLRFSERAVRAIGLTPQQYQLILAIKGYPDRDWATLSEIAERLQTSHNSVVGLVDRSAGNDLVRRDPHPRDRRAVAVRLTDRGHEVLARLVSVHRRELERLAEMLRVPPFIADEREMGAPVDAHGQG